MSWLPGVADQRSKIQALRPTSVRLVQPASIYVPLLPPRTLLCLLLGLSRGPWADLLHKQGGRDRCVTSSACPARGLVVPLGHVRYLHSLPLLLFLLTVQSLAGSALATVEGVVCMNVWTENKACPARGSPLIEFGLSSSLIFECHTFYIPYSRYIHLSSKLN